MKSLIFIVSMMATPLLIGCSLLGAAVVQEEAALEILGFGEFDTARHGIVTVDEIFARSDIVVIPPNIEHVIWVRSAMGDRFRWTEVKNGETQGQPMETFERTEIPQTTQRSWDEEYPLLLDHGDFGTEYARVPMCIKDGLLEPCEDEHRYECYGSKGGGYCLARGLNQ